MTKKITTYCQHHPTTMVPKEPMVDEKGGDPVIEWEKYMDHHGSTAGGIANRCPMFTYSLMILCTIVLLFSFHLNDWTMESFRYNSSFGPSSETLIRMGVLSTKLLLAPAGPNDNNDENHTMEWYRIISTIGIHGGILHWICNMMAILFIGVPLERRHGTIMIGGTFLIASIAANIGTLIYSPFEFILSPLGGICSWYGFRLSHIFTHFCTLRQLYKPPPSIAVILSESPTALNASLSRTTTKSPQQFPFRPTQLAIILEIIFFLLIGLLPWINQFSNCCGFLYGMVIGLHLFQPSGSTYNVIQLCRRAVYLVMTNDGSKTKVLRIIQGWTYHLYLPVRRRIIPGILFCIIVGFSTSNVLYLFYSSNIGDLPCRSCHYIDCVPWPDTIYQHCEPCNYLEIEYVTIEKSTAGDDDDTSNDNTTANAITISSQGHIENGIDSKSALNNAGNTSGPNYFIEMTCPYGESTFFVIPNHLPQNRKEWIQSCHNYCELSW